MSMSMSSSAEKSTAVARARVLSEENHLAADSPHLPPVLRRAHLSAIYPSGGLVLQLQLFAGPFVSF